MQAQDPLWAHFLLAIAKGQRDDIDNCRQLQTRFGIIVTRDIERARSFFFLGVRPRDHFPLDHQWVCATNKLVNQVNHNFQQWRRQEAQALGIVSAFIQFIKPVLKCPGLSELQQIDFIEKMVPLTCLQTTFSFWRVVLSFYFVILILGPVWQKADVVVPYK
jgi:hypothetical protein